jgi:uncharacterized protein Yka (UPF0111/DUF47 family)
MKVITLKELMDIVENVEMYNSEYQLIEDKFKELLSTKLKTIKVMKTPMQELIDTLKELQETQDPYTLQDAIEHAESMLGKEKEYIKKNK